MNGFRKLQERLKELGWYLGWNEPCCQSCAWGSLPDYLDAEYDDNGHLIRTHPETGQEMSWAEIDKVYREIDLDKVLFNHSQDCEVDYDFEDCEQCQGGGCEACEFEGAIKVLSEEGEFDRSVGGFICHTPEQQSSSMFCFSGDSKGVQNLKEILPIIEECGCDWNWDKTGKSRITISW